MAITLYMCTECKKCFHEEWKAKDCCPRKPVEVFECDSCDRLYVKESDADRCCDESRDG